MSRYRRDPETGAVFAWGGVLGIRSADIAREERENHERMLIRRADILAKPLTFSQRLARERAIERELGWTGIPEVDYAALLRRRSAELGVSTQRVSRPVRRSRPPVLTRGRYTSHSKGMVVAQESFDYIDPVMGRQHIKAGISHVSYTSEAYRRFPEKFAA
jgi:hypothetical protein